MVHLAEVSALLCPEKPSVAYVTNLKFYFALRREGEALASSSPSPSTFRRAQRPRPPSLHRRPTSSTPGMTKKRPVGLWLKPQGQENDDTTRVKREQHDRAPAPTTCTPARPTRRDRAWHAGLSQRDASTGTLPLLLAAGFACGARIPEFQKY